MLTNGAFCLIIFASLFISFITQITFDNFSNNFSHQRCRSFGSLNQYAQFACIIAQRYYVGKPVDYQTIVIWSHYTDKQPWSFQLI